MSWMTKLTLDSVEWKEFKFTDIFTKIQRGKRLTKGDQIEGGIPYVSSTSINNGVDNFISKCGFVFLPTILIYRE